MWLLPCPWLLPCLWLLPCPWLSCRDPLHRKICAGEGDRRFTGLADEDCQTIRPEGGRQEAPERPRASESHPFPTPKVEPAPSWSVHMDVGWGGLRSSGLLVVPLSRLCSLIKECVMEVEEPLGCGLWAGHGLGLLLVIGARAFSIGQAPAGLRTWG